MMLQRYKNKNEANFLLKEPLVEDHQKKDMTNFSF